MTERRPDDRSRVAEALAAGSAADCIRDVLAHVQGAPSLRFQVEGAPFALPPRTVFMLVDLLEDVSEGRDVTIAPADVVVGTTEASRVLGVSRTWVARLADDGELESDVRGSKRRIRLGSLMARRRGDAARVRHASRVLAESLDLVASEAREAPEQRAVDVAATAMASALLVPQPRPADLEREDSEYIAALTSGAGSVSPHDPGGEHEPTLAA